MWLIRALNTCKLVNLTEKSLKKVNSSNFVTSGWIFFKFQIPVSMPVLGFSNGPVLKPLSCSTSQSFLRIYFLKKLSQTEWKYNACTFDSQVDI